MSFSSFVLTSRTSQAAAETAQLLVEVERSNTDVSGRKPDPCACATTQISLLGAHTSDKACPLRFCTLHGLIAYPASP